MSGIDNNFKFEHLCVPLIGALGVRFMRAYLVLGVAVSLICGCATRRDRQDLAGYSSPIVFTLQGIRATDNNCHIASFEMKNVGDSDMWFTGDSRGGPDYYVQRELSIGGWDGDTPEGRDCGMDMGRWRLAAGAATNLTYRFWPQQEHPGRFRVGVRLSPSKFLKPGTPNVIYWSEPISP